ncbi:hypothetical protein FBY41_1597 [Humibacillus xanthopallidus]|uniref:Uncharacterized protein n=1 Tax=Humibacillus xanthopallidus TaxID=412689 RepID=A0A543I410_9MICO|nr:hypothetical protein FBY41_1597 [Humibacillus xanthopallidus]
MFGTATLTIVESTMMRATAMLMATSPYQRRREFPSDTMTSILRGPDRRILPNS